MRHQSGVFQFPMVSLYMDLFYKAHRTMNTGLVLCGGLWMISNLGSRRRLLEPDLQRPIVASNRQVISLSDFERVEAQVFALESDHLLIETTQNQFLYAASSTPETAIISGKVQLYLDIEVEVGAFSVAIEDPSSGTFTTREIISTLIGVDVELLRKLSQCSTALNGGKRHLRPESRCVVPAGSSAHCVS